MPEPRRAPAVEEGPRPGPVARSLAGRAAPAARSYDRGPASLGRCDSGGDERAVPHRSPAADALRRAGDFLQSALDPDGLYRDFDTLAGQSDEWVSAYVACALAETGRPGPLRLARRVWSRLRRRRRLSAGWGYNRFVPSDADSTLWVLRLASLLDVTPSWKILRARRFLRRHVGTGGGVSTFAEAGAIRVFTGLSRDVSFAGWCAPHPCVTGPAAMVDHGADPRTRDFLLRSRSADGSWSGYWWCDPEYATAWAVEALSISGDPSAADAARSGAAWAAGRDDRYASPFTRALRLRALTCVPHAGALEARVRNREALLSAQLPDGSWAASARLRIPPPHVVDPDDHPRWIEGARGGESIQVDRGRRFTTATVLAALACDVRRPERA